MQVTVEAIPFNLGNRGITLTIADNDGSHVGHLRIGQATVEWRRGRTREGNGKKIRLSDLIDYLDSL